MKFILSLLLLFFIASPAAAQTPTENSDEIASPTEEARTNTLTEQINDLKNKIASRVAELDLVDKRGVIGTVREVKNTQITITDQQEKTRIVDVDGITKFSSSAAKSTFGISDLTRGTQINIIGLYNKQSRRILARFIEVSPVPEFITGVITDVDTRGFTFSVLDTNDVTTVVDVENITRTNTYTNEGDIVRTGFSKIAAFDRVIVTGYPSKTEKNRLTGIRVLLLPDAPENPGISFTAPEEPISPAPTQRITPTPSDNE